MSEKLTKNIRRKLEAGIREAKQGLVTDTLLAMVNRYTRFSLWTRVKVCWWMVWRKPKRLFSLLLNAPVTCKETDLFGNLRAEAKEVYNRELAKAVKAFAEAKNAKISEIRKRSIIS